MHYINGYRRACIAGLWVAVKYKLLTAKFTSSVGLFCLIIAVLSLIMLGLDAFVGDEGGALASVPGVKQLQERLGVIDAKLDKVLAGQKEAVAPLRSSGQRRWRDRKRLERLVIDSAGGGAQALKAIADIRDLLRPGNPEIDAISAEQLPKLVQRIIEDLLKPAARPEDFAGTVRRVLQEAQAQTAKLKFADAAKILDAALAQAEAEDQDRARGRAPLLAERGRVKPSTALPRGGALLRQSCGSGSV